MTTATIIPSLTSNPPSRANPAAFPTDGDSFLNDLAGIVSAQNTVASELTTWNSEIETFKNQSAASETNAESSENTALTQARNAAASQVSLWVSGTTYAVNQMVYSNADGRQYKRILAGAGTTDPSSDPTNWEPLGWEYITNYPDIRPTLDLNFAGSQAVDPRITFTRNSIATYFDKFGVMQTAGVNQPRIDFDPVTGECKGLLIEEQRTNLLTYSEEFNNIAWSKVGGVIIANVVSSPDGAITSDSLAEDTSSGLHIVYRSTPLTSGTSYTLSFWVRRGVGNRNVSARLDDGASTKRSFINLTTGAVTPASGHTVTARTVGAFWYVTCTVTAAATASAVVGIELADGVSPTYTGDGTSSVYIWGAQLEAGAFPTSYIPTTSAQVTRSADAASMTGTNFSSWYRQDEGTLFAETRRTGTAQTADEGAGVELTSGEFQKNLIQLMYDSGSYNRVSVRVFSASGLLGFAGPSNSPNFTVGEAARKFAAAVMSGGTALASNGSVGASYSETFTPPLVTMLSIKTTSNGAQGSDFNGYIKKIAYYPKRLPNATLQAITQP